MRKMQIGEFSKLTRLSIKALRHYDSQGLLVPAQVDQDTGYRYYDHSQLKVADSIHVLRSLDMSVAEIKALLQSEDTSQTVSGLQSHRQRIQEEVAAKQRVLNYLDALIEAKQLLLSYDVSVQECKPQKIASVQFDTSLSSIGQDIQQGFGELIIGLQSLKLEPTGAPVIVYHDVIDADSAGRVEVGVPVNAQNLSTERLSLRELEGGLIAQTVHTGPYQSVGPAYQALARWMAEHAYEVIGPPRERYLNDPQTTPEEQLLTSVEFPVQREG